VATIRIGPGGIPLSCKGRTIKDGVIYTRNLELDAIQVQFVRGIRTTEEEALEVGRVAREANVEVHVHAPYYTNIAGDEPNKESAFDKIISAGALADAMGARTLAIHAGLYDDAGPQVTLEKIVEGLAEILDTFKEDGINVRLGLEVAGKQALFGSLDEVIEVCRRVPGVVPILDFAHIHARTNGGLQTPEDFARVFDQVREFNLEHYLIHFTGVLYENGSERHHIPIKKGDLRFEPLVETILDRDLNVTIVSHSPILEHDAMYMKIVLDRVKERRELRAQREKALALQEAEREKARKERERVALERQKEKERVERQKQKEREAIQRKKEQERKKAEKEAARRAKEAAKKKAAQEKERAKKAAAKKKPAPKPKAKAPAKKRKK
jgi:deoxyribonuclease IV